MREGGEIGENVLLTKFSMYNMVLLTISYNNVACEIYYIISE